MDSKTRKVVLKKLDEAITLSAKALGITKTEILKRTGFIKPINNYSTRRLMECTNRILTSLKFTSNFIKKSKKGGESWKIKK